MKWHLMVKSIMHDGYGHFILNDEAELCNYMWDLDELEIDAEYLIAYSDDDGELNCEL